MLALLPLNSKKKSGQPRTHKHTQSPNIFLLPLKSLKVNEKCLSIFFITSPFCLLLSSRWCCWHAARATAATRPAPTPSSHSAQCSNSPSRAPAPAAGRTPPSWRRWGCAALAGLALRPLTDTSSPATARSAAEQTAAPSQTLKTLKSRHFSWPQTFLSSCPKHFGWLLDQKTAPEILVVNLWVIVWSSQISLTWALKLTYSPWDSDRTYYTLSIMCIQSVQTMQSIFLQLTRPDTTNCSSQEPAGDPPRCRDTLHSL